MRPPHNRMEQWLPLAYYPQLDGLASVSGSCLLPRALRRPRVSLQPCVRAGARSQGKASNHAGRQPSLRPRDPTVRRRLCKRAVAPAARVSVRGVSTQSELRVRCTRPPAAPPPSHSSARSCASLKEAGAREAVSRRRWHGRAPGRGCKADHAVARLRSGRAPSARLNGCAPA